jgi:hypothetical protein
MGYIFNSTRELVDADAFTAINKTITEFKIIDNIHNPGLYSTEIIELISKFLEFCENFDKNSWFDTNLKLISKLIENIEYDDAIDIIINLLSYTKFITNHFDRVYTIFNLFYRLIMMNINYCNYFEKESLILCLFKQDWFVFLINKDNCDEKESRFRHDLFICLIEALFYAKIHLLKTENVKKFIFLIKICLDIIDVCFKIIEWSDEGEAYKMYFLVLEETCLFFDDAFFCFIYGHETEFANMKTRLEQVLVEISKRFNNKVWTQLSFANENSKYRSVLLLSQFLNIDYTSNINTILEVIFLRMNEIPFDKHNEKFVEQILKSCLFLGVRVNTVSREKIIENLTDFVEKVKLKYDADISILNNIRSFAENILNYLLDHKNDPQIILDSKIVDKLNNEFYLIIPKEVESNIPNKIFNYNNLYLINLCENSNYILDNYYEENSSVYLDYFKKLAYFSMLESNNEFSHLLIDNVFTYKFSDWKLVTGISDAIHIYYMYRINIETREVELYVKAYNTTSCVLQNLIFQVFLSKNLTLLLTGNISQHSNKYINHKEINLELLSPFSSYDFSIKFTSSIFEKNNITIDCTFDMNTDYSSSITLSSESFYIPLIDYCLPDNFALFETKIFDIFYTTLEYTFTCKCYAVCTPENLIKSISERFIMVEYKGKNSSQDKTKTIMDRLKETRGYFRKTLERDNSFINSEDNQRYNFKIKIASYCIYNFWIYITILGDYNFSNNKSILNIEIKSNDLGALNVISKERAIFFNELLNKNIKFY